MFEKVNPSHPDKIADRIAGALVDAAYEKEENPRIAVEVLIGHESCHIIAETSVHFENEFIESIVSRITGIDPSKDFIVIYDEYPQNVHLAENQIKKIRCGDNGIFKGQVVTAEQQCLSAFVRNLYEKYPYDGKFIYSINNKIVACQSNIDSKVLKAILRKSFLNSVVIVNPLGEWTGGINVDTGATNRKLGSDMGDAVTGGGLHGKDLSKADVSVNIYAHIRANQLGTPVEFSCAIGDEYVDGLPYSAIVEIAKDYIFNQCGGFEKFAEWGLI